jgi:hypothetical protein
MLPILLESNKLLRRSRRPQEARQRYPIFFQLRISTGWMERSAEAFGFLGAAASSGVGIGQFVAHSSHILPRRRPSSSLAGFT